MNYSALCGDYDSEIEEHEIELEGSSISHETLKKNIKFERSPKVLENIDIFVIE
jgi:hypothetical protein